MPQSAAFFGLLFRFADALARRTGESAENLLWAYTPISKSLGISAPFDESNPTWRTFMEPLRASGDPARFAHAWYAERIGPDPQMGDPTFHGHPLFGPFYYEMRVGGTVRPHVAKLQPYSPSFLDRERRDESRRHLARMFAAIRESEPGARTVLGNSWIYNVPAYRDLYPPEFTRELPESSEDEFHYLAMWGQFFDREWNVRVDPTSHLLEAVSRLSDLQDLRLCFPYQVLTPRADIETFFEFYGVPD